MERVWVIVVIIVIKYNKLKRSSNSFINLHSLSIPISKDIVNNSKGLYSGLRPNNSVRLKKSWFFTKRSNNKIFKTIKLNNKIISKHKKPLSESKTCSPCYLSHHQVNNQTKLFILNIKETFLIRYLSHPKIIQSK